MKTKLGGSGDITTISHSEMGEQYIIDRSHNELHPDNYSE